MAFDASPLASIGTNLTAPIAEAPARALTLSDLVNKEQVSRLALKDEQDTQNTYEAIKKETKGMDWSKPEDQHRIIAIAAEKSPKIAMQMTREFTAQQSAQAELTKESIGLVKEQLDFLNNAATPFVAQARQLQAQGKSDDEISAALLPKITQTLGTLKDARMSNGQPIMTPEIQKEISALVSPGGNIRQGLEDFAQGHAQVMEKLAAIDKQRADQAHITAETEKDKASAVNIPLQEKERERHDRAMEAKGVGATPGVDSGKVGGVYAAMADLGISFPPGMRAVKAQHETIQGLLATHPNDTPQQIAQRVKSGELGFKGAGTELNVVARREGASAAAINALNRGGGLYDQLAETGKKVNFGSAKFNNALRLWKQGAAIADPDISEYVNALADTRAEFASVLARGGQVTDSVRIASEHAFPDKMSLSELTRNIERSRKIADAIQSGNTSVADAIIKGTPLEDALKASSTPPAAPTAPAPSSGGAAGGAGAPKTVSWGDLPK
jgi:hypothetical protein